MLANILSGREVHIQSNEGADEFLIMVTLSDVYLTFANSSVERAGGSYSIFISAI